LKKRGKLIIKPEKFKKDNLKTISNSKKCLLMKLMNPLWKTKERSLKPDWQALPPFSLKD